MNWKIIIFHAYFFNMNILVILRYICLKMCIHIAEIYSEGSVSQTSLDKNVFYTYLKFGTCRCNINPCSKSKSGEFTDKFALLLLCTFQQYPLYH